MKKLNFIATIILLIFISTLQSCMDGSNDNWMNNSDEARVAIVTIRKVDATPSSKFYLMLDDGKTIYPTVDIGIETTTLKEGQRAFAYLRIIDNQSPEAVAGYDYNAVLFRLVHILTKDIIPLTEETADSIGDDRINLTNPWIAQGYLTMEFQYHGTQDVSRKHMLNLVQNETQKLVDTEGYINLEFRHNAFNDPQTKTDEGVVSFKLDKVNEEMKTAKGLKIRVKTIYDGIQYYKIDFGKHSEESKISTAEQLNLTIDTFKTNY